ncbi:MAG TPA: HIT domain-containing protein [Caulobacteraceae bacterium]|jgi:diadenosine tetraphosphate (Ap4A) HIT family hydrolase|nr:HIT domain-containing protein [Caulobacteraceae bacterium]
MAVFAIDPRLLSASEPLASLKLSEARLQADARWPWIVLVPRKVGARELEHLTAADRATLMEEAVAAGVAVRAIGAASGRPVEKLNIGALGNRVEQLHLHVVGRRADDPAWPDPVWGMGEPRAYSESVLAAAREAALTALQGMKRK